MPQKISGPHHCIGTARTVADLIFRYLHSRCQSAGGNLSDAALTSAHLQFVGSIPSAFDFFTTVHQCCMKASESPARPLFTRDTILASLLFALSHKVAQQAFSDQIERFGETWLRQFFDGFSHYTQDHVCTMAGQRLIARYAEIAVKLQNKITLDDLLGDDSIQYVLRECVRPFVAVNVTNEFVAHFSNTVSVYIAGQAGIANPELCKVTEVAVK